MSKNYAFKNFVENVFLSTSAMTGLVAFGIGLANVFNPLVLAAVGTYAASKVGASYLMRNPTFKNWSMNRMIKAGHAEPVSEEAPVNKVVKEISDSLGRLEAPKVYTIDVETVSGIVLPMGLRWLVKLKRGREFLSEKVMPTIFAAIPGANILLTTKEALAQNLPEKELRFIVAHEMSHLQADDLSPVLYSKAIVKTISQPLMIVAGLAVGMSAFGISVPLTVGFGAFSALKGLAALVGIRYVANIAVNAGMRGLEKRADRNALYITRDLGAAESAMNHLHGPSERQPRSLLSEAGLDHPSYINRIISLGESFNKVSQYPKLSSANDNDAMTKHPEQSMGATKLPNKL